MKIFSYSRPRDHISEENLRWFLQVAEDSGVDYAVNEEYAEMAADDTGIVLPPEKRYGELTRKDISDDTIMIAVGGDGTFLDAVRRLKGLPIPIVGVNMGRLGFLANISPQDLPQALEYLKNHRYSIERRPLLEIKGDFGSTPEFPCALNEFTIHRNEASMVEVEVYADEDLIAISRGDGVIVSTPTGSTAYSLSAGGPIVSPECSCIILTALAPHNFTMRPLVLPDNSSISLRISSRGNRAKVSIDNNSYLADDGAQFTVRRSKFSTFLVHLQNISFYDTLRNKMMWGLDKRDLLR